MAEYDKSRFYWIRLTDRFMTSDTVDFLMSQKDGANYVVLYQMLCLKTVNNGGIMARKLGEMIVPYDIEKIQRDCKWFSVDTVRIALELYKKLGLIYENTEGVLVISNFDRLIGSQSYGAERKELQRSRVLSEGGQKVDICPPDKEKEKEIEIDKELYKKEHSTHNNSGGRKHKVFVPPTLEEVKKYAEEKGRSDLADRFFEYYTEGNWIDGKGNPVKNWKQKFLTWRGKNEPKVAKGRTSSTNSSFDTGDFMAKALAKSYNKGARGL